VVSSFLVFFSICLFIVLFVVQYKKRQAEFEFEKTQMQLAFQHESAKAQMEMTEITLRRLSQEIHDNIGQKMALASMQLNASPLTSDTLENSKYLIQQSLQDIRDLSKSLNDSYQLDLGLHAGIKRELKLIQDTNTCSTTFSERQHESEYSLTSKEELILFRCIQEALSNIIKHAAATEITVEVEESALHYTIQIKDNGKGFDATTITENIGLRSIRERIALLKGNIQIISSPNKGTTIIFTLKSQNHDQASTHG
jgi:hypothetical protein